MIFDTFKQQTIHIWIIYESDPKDNSNIFQYNIGIKLNIFVICIIKSMVFLLTMRHNGDLMMISVNLILWFLKSKTFVAPFITRFGSFPFHSSILKPNLHLNAQNKMMDSVKKRKEFLYVTCVSLRQRRVATSYLFGLERYLLCLNCFSSSKSCCEVKAVRGRRVLPSKEWG